MSVAGFLEKLLDGAEVVWKPLGDIAQYSTTRIGSDQLNESNYVGVDNLLQNRAGRIDSNYVPTSGNFTEFKEGDVLIGNIRPYLRKIWYADRRGGTNGDVLVVHPTDSVLNSRYLFQVLTDENFFEYNIQHSKGAKMPRGSKPHILQYLVPIPCPDDPEKSLLIQGEIVRILDTFTELTAELTAELIQRKKQYNHYREQLLTFDENEVEWKTLGDVAEFRRGTAITKTQTKKGKIPVVANGPISTYSHDQHNRDGETVVVARSGAYAGYVSYWNQPIFLTDAFSVHPAPNLLLPKFVFYLLQNKQRQLHDMKKGAGVPHVRVKEVEQYGIPIPSLTEQANIVAILDKFDTLTSSISEGLPREIELREKQYAWYRDQLLSFPKPDVESA
ncbi:type I restriction endonuclease subunit S [Komagataeibacter saccharivorans]|uniref:restriction endonuclease subunit S n=1 Tax=Komagataeibacter saccharivorans TaxID=265959 RepID=UPI000D7C2697|nr:restriction endonuclease subunit S [Komagataeibacter saccharivorans]PYD49749.1 type I restriction endonuclease subunit S [Komagataeibacter saccharivorans]GBQ41922.1 restriction endonuclease S subunit [Komagataeibacter saccharivorans NRIC 0614]